MSKGRIIGVISIKGGVGKTTAVSNLGAVLANEFGKKVLLIDANFTAPNLGLHLGVIKPEVSIHDVMSGKIPATEAIYTHDYGFHIIPASLTSGKIDPYKLKEKISRLKDYYDIILLDSSPNLNEEILSTMVASDELLVITSPDYPTLSCTLNAVKVAKAKKTTISGLILNRVRNKKYELTVDDIEDTAKTPVLGILPEDATVLESLYFTKPAALHKEKARVVYEYKKLAAALIGEEYKDPRFTQKVKRLLQKDIPKDEVNRALFRSNLNG